MTQLPGANEFPEAEWSTAYTPCRSYVKGRDSWGAADEASRYRLAPGSKRFESLTWFCLKMVHIRVSIYIYIWVNYNDLTATSLEIMVSKGHHPQNGRTIQVSEILYNLPRYIYIYTVYIYLYVDIP